MKKITVKKQLVDFMITNGNDFRYTEMIKATLRICRGKNYVYTRADRGFYGTNFCSDNGYMVNGGGDCGVYKNAQGRWSAKYFTQDDMLINAITRQVTKLVRQTQYAEFRYRDLYKRYIGTGPDYDSYIRKEYFKDIETAKETTIKKIKKAVTKLV